MPIEMFVTVAGVFVLTCSICATIYLGFANGNRPVRRQLQDLGSKIRVSEGNYDQAGMPTGGLAESILNWAQRRVRNPNPNHPRVGGMVELLQHAGFYAPEASGVFHLVRLCSTVTAALVFLALGAIMGGTAPIIFVYCFVGLALGYLIPLYYVRWMASSRQLKIRRELSDVIDLLVVCVECGLGLLASIRIVGRESKLQGRVLGGQFAMLSNELTAGATLGDALRSLAARTGVEDIATFAAILIQSEKLGTEMGQALRATSEQLRAKRGLRAEELAQKLPIKMVIPLVTLLLPAMMMLLVAPTAISIFRGLNFR